ncbi:Hypothetical protein CINCED_3A018025 [Cinara cedri]|uniref:Uncharacterized protein n=1 Tax=Cinara cedri TaxID=506608 RepID=A0A5E4MGI5_9HEMI|nr:Hypothetical protein CINCED_3A018025 [Cinara cedri]
MNDWCEQVDMKCMESLRMEGFIIEEYAKNDRASDFAKRSNWAWGRSLNIMESPSDFKVDYLKDYVQYVKGIPSFNSNVKDIKTWCIDHNLVQQGLIKRDQDNHTISLEIKEDKAHLLYEENILQTALNSIFNSVHRRLTKLTISSQLKLSLQKLLEFKLNNIDEDSADGNSVTGCS